MHLRTVFAWATLAWALVFSALWSILWFLGRPSLFRSALENPLFDGTTLCITLALCLTAYALIRWASATLFPVVLVPVVVLHLFYFPRLACYLLMPTYLTSPFDHFLKTAKVNEALLIVLAGLWAVALGLFGGEKIFERFFATKVRTRLAPVKERWRGLLQISAGQTFLTVTFLIWMALEFFYERVLGLGIFNPSFEGQFRTFWVGLRVFLGLDVCFFLVLGVLFFQWIKTRRGLYTAAILAFLYLFTLTYGGSKGGVLRLDLMLLTLASMIFADKKLPIKAYVAIAVVSVVMGYVTFYAGTVARTASLGWDFSLFTSMAKSEAVFNRVYASDLDQPKALDGPPIARPIRRALPVLDRMGEIDYPIYILSNEPSPEHREHYLSFQYLAKSLGNIFAPGTPYPEAELPTNRLLAVFYRGKAESSALAGFNSEPWSIWSVATLYFGRIGGLAFLFVVCFAFQLFYRTLLALLPSDQPVLAAFVLWNVGYVFFKCFGLDHFISFVAFTILQVVTLYLWFYFVPSLASVATPFLRSRQRLRDA